MKCKQTLCQRNNNLKNSSNCNVCEEAITASFTEIHPEKVVETVQTDLKVMISTCERGNCREGCCKRFTSGGSH